MVVPEARQGARGVCGVRERTAWQAMRDIRALGHEPPGPGSDEWRGDIPSGLGRWNGGVFKNRFFF